MLSHLHFSQDFFSKLGKVGWVILSFLLAFALNQCVSTPPGPELPPSQSDLGAIGRENLCQTKSTSLIMDFEEAPWGGGKEFHKHLGSPEDQYQWLMFNEDDILVGAVTVYTNGLSLDPYPLLRQTLSQLPPSKEFFFNSSQLLREQDPDSAILYRTGEATTTHQYVIRKRKNQDDELVMVVFLLDPYERLFEGQHQRFLSHMTPDLPPVSSSSQAPVPQGASDKEFLALQQFARGELSLFGSCGTKHPDIALEAYRQAIKLGLPDKGHHAEALHRMGLALKSLGKFEDAKISIEQSLSLQPHSATMLNSYGTVLTELKQLEQAIQAYEQALALKPDYAHARFNLAEAFELINPNRAIQEYETFLILVEDNLQESSKTQLARQRIESLQKGHR
ncbi:MAG: tetratricopeptide repeat protein [Nitrospirales bacterium]